MEALTLCCCCCCCCGDPHWIAGWPKSAFLAWHSHRSDSLGWIICWWNTGHRRSSLANHWRLIEIITLHRSLSLAFSVFPHFDRFFSLSFLSDFFSFPFDFQWLSDFSRWWNACEPCVMSKQQAKTHRLTIQLGFDLSIRDLVRFLKLAEMIVSWKANEFFWLIKSLWSLLAASQSLIRFHISVRSLLIRCEFLLLRRLYVSAALSFGSCSPSHRSPIAFSAHSETLLFLLVLSFGAIR